MFDLLDDSGKVGAFALVSGGVKFRVWAPKAKSVDLLLSVDGQLRTISMAARDRGYYEIVSREAGVGSQYRFRLDGKGEVPDPASRYQPEGPHGPSEVVEEKFAWTDANWKNISFDQLVIYELHVGTFSDAGTFSGVEAHLDHLVKMGINAIEIMPIAQFAGKRNWGYDGVGLFAPQSSYGAANKSPDEFKHLVNACHARGLAVFLDVVYNHLGPEGNYLPQFGAYFQDKYKTPWGEALNFDGEGSDEVRKYFLQNARQWFEEYHVDGLRLDAVHAILDTSARPFLEELGRLKLALQEKLDRPLYLIAESDANDPRILKTPDEGGQAMDGHWADDLHHVVHVLMTGEKRSYYSEYGAIQQLAKIYENGVLFQGQFSEARNRSHGRSYEGVDRSRLVVCSQNHDQIGNRKEGDRLIVQTGDLHQKIAAATVMLSPGLPLLFMGEEFGSRSPFPYFIDHTDHELLEAVREGRKKEFSGFNWEGEVPDPASVETFQSAKLKWSMLSDERSQDFQSYYRKLISASKWLRAERLMEDGRVRVEANEKTKALHVWSENQNWRYEAFFAFDVDSADSIRTIRSHWNLSNTGQTEILIDTRNKDADNNQIENRMSGNASLEMCAFGVLALRTALA